MVFHLQLLPMEVQERGGEAKVGFVGVSFGLTFGVGGGFDVTWELKKGKKTNGGSHGRFT